MLDDALKNVEKFVSIKYQQFNKLPDTYKKRVVAKTAIVATAAGLTAGYLAGTTLSVIAFAATAIYVGSSVLDRISSNTAFKKIFADIGKDAYNVAEDLGTAFAREVEDLFDAFFSNNPKMNQKKAADRKKADLNTDSNRFLRDLYDEFMFTMSL